MYKKKERAVAYMLKIFESIAETYGREILLTEMPEEVYVPVIGRSLKKYTIKRYAEHVIKYCLENGHTLPVRKEYVKDSKRGKLLKLVIDPIMCRTLSSQLVADLKLRVQRRHEYAKELYNLKKKLEKYEAQIRELTSKKEETTLRKYLNEAAKYLTALLNLMKMIGNYEAMKKCVEKLESTLECKIVVKIIDRATVAHGNESIVDIFVDNYEANHDYKKRVDSLSLEKHIKEVSKLLDSIKSMRAS